MGIEKVMLRLESDILKKKYAKTGILATTHAHVTHAKYCCKC